MILKFFIECLKMRFSEQMVYKTNFFIRTFTMLSFDAIMLLITFLIYNNSQGFAGWSLMQILLFQGIYIFVNSLDRMFFQGVDWNLSYDVRSGSFDRYLLYPVNALTYISFTNLMTEHFGDVSLGLALIIYSSVKLNIELTLLKIILFLLIIFMAILFIFSLAVLRYSIILRIVRIGRLGELFRTIKYYAQYPTDIYGSMLSTFLKFIIPMAILAYFPSTVLIRGTIENLPPIMISIGVIFILTLSFWRHSLKHYASAGG